MDGALYKKHMAKSKPKLTVPSLVESMLYKKSKEKVLMNSQAITNFNHKFSPSKARLFKK